MSERGGSGIGSFLLGVALGAAVGLLFAPEGGVGTRGKLGRRVKQLRDGAMESVDELRGLLAAGAEPDAGADDDEAPVRSTREELSDRLAEARRRRRGKGAAAGTEAAEEDEPVA
ncbi:MAG TPA: YtxH domain-containing protein [Gemmatimonadales bacterium]|nr:YtxH domain-containing protein [Gemmatimonadales bacterium]